MGSFSEDKQCSRCYVGLPSSCRPQEIILILLPFSLKTEALLFPFSSSLKPSTVSLPDSITLGSHNIPFSDSARNLGFILDSKLSMKKHVIKLCQTTYFKLKRISSIHRFLTEDATKTLVTSYILSRLDYCNCLLMGHLILSSNLYRKFRTLLQDLFSWHPITTT